MSRQHPATAGEGRLVEEGAFAADSATHHYYERRAGEYDEWYRGEGLFAERERPGWHEELDRLCALLGALVPSTTLDVACGTAFLSMHLRGRIVGVDRSQAMVEIARGRIGSAATADALALPVGDGAVERVFTAHFYGHLPPGERAVFLAEARRAGHDLVVVDTARRPDHPAHRWQERVLNDGSRHRVFKRFLTVRQLAAEIGGGPLFDGRWFVAARASLNHRAGPTAPRTMSATAIDSGTTTAPRAL